MTRSEPGAQRIGWCAPGLPTDNADDAVLGHEPPDLVPTDDDALSPRLLGHRAHAVDLIVVVHETHRLGVFGQDDWLRIIVDAGFDASVVTEVMTEARTPRQVFVGKAAGRSGRPLGARRRA